jgi:putative restriction endonuclease
MWLEMSQNSVHGGLGWAFTECLLSPTHQNPSGSWSFWEILKRVRKGDIVFHLRGKSPRTDFVGYSIADSNGYQTQDRPPMPGQWAYATSFYRVPLTGFVPFLDPIPLGGVFSERDVQLREYFSENKSRPRRLHEHIFFVVQAGRLQCLNGAYLSEFGEELANIILGPRFGGKSGQANGVSVSARTGEQIAQVKARIGQSVFSANVRQNYGNRCCFPGCSVAEDRFLVGAHIARWSDARELRGDTSNGLCFCLLHDRAFEIGLFTLTAELRIAANSAKLAKSPWAKENIAPYEGEKIALGAIKPAVESVRQHWERIGFVPNRNDA